jgi:hypothetical protein
MKNMYGVLMSVVMMEKACLNVSGDDGEGRGCSFGMRETVYYKEIIDVDKIKR